MPNQQLWEGFAHIPVKGTRRRCVKITKNHFAPGLLCNLNAQYQSYNYQQLLELHIVFYGISWVANENVPAIVNSVKMLFLVSGLPAEFTSRLPRQRSENFALLSAGK